MIDDDEVSANIMIANSDPLQQKQQPAQTENAYNFIYDYLLEILPSQAFPLTASKQHPEYANFCAHYQSILEKSDPSEHIITYTKTLVQFDAMDEAFFQHFVENKFLSTVMARAKATNFASSVVKAMFASLECLLKGIRREEHYVYMLVCIAKEGLVTHSYRFAEEEDWAYYAHFLKLLIRSINQADRGSYNSQQPKSDDKYLSIFFNPSTPHFPLLLRLFKLHHHPDTILQASVKLSLLQLTTHPNATLQKYLLNFPFVTFYALYMNKMWKALKTYITTDVEWKIQSVKEQLTEDLKFMEDFMGKVEENSVIHMYVNAYWNFIGRFLYQEMLRSLEYPTQNKSIIMRLLKLIEMLIRLNSIVKIRVGFQSMFHKYINIHFMDYLKRRSVKLDENYWLFQECENEVKEHAGAVFWPSREKSAKKSSSFFKTMHSYVPKTKPNWFYYELKKLSEILGIEINLYKEVDHYCHEGAYQQTYLHALDLLQSFTFNKSVITLQESEQSSLLEKHQNPYRSNPLFQAVLKTDNEEIIFYYILLLALLGEDDCQSAGYSFRGEEQICELVYFGNRCISLGVLGVLYRYIKVQNIGVDDRNAKYLPKSQKTGQQLLQIYMNTMQKLVYFILTEGWPSFISRINSIKPLLEEQSLNNSKFGKKESKFFNDVFRDTQADILYFILLRHLFGTKNTECETKLTDQHEFNEVLSKQVKMSCWTSKPTGEKLHLVLRGQYIELLNMNDQPMTKQIPVTCINIYEQDHMLEFVEKEPEGESYSLRFQESSLRQYCAKQIMWRRKTTIELELWLRTACFPVQ